VRFLLDRVAPKNTIPSPAILGHIGRAYVHAIDMFALYNGLPIVKFNKGERKEDVAARHFRRAERENRYGVLLIGVAQEKASVWRGWRHGGSDDHPHFEFERQAAHINHYYWYIRDREWGPSFIKTNAYAPFPVWVYLNGNEYAKQQAIRAGLAFEPLDNGFRSCADPAALDAICQRLSARDVQAYFERWMRVLPSPFTQAERAAYPYRLSVRQMELSDTRVFDRPAAGRAWFERSLVDQLTLGRPDRVMLTFGKKLTRATPGRFETLVISRGVQPRIEARYKHSRVKQYLKQGRALRTETTINDPYDFGVGRELTDRNWQALCQLGHNVNARLLGAQLEACQCAPDPAALQAVVLPSVHDGQPAPGLRFGDPRVMALLACACHYGHLFAGLTNRSLRAMIETLIPGYSARQATYDLRRLRRKGLIYRVPRTQRYELTGEGRKIAVFFTKTYTRIVNPSLAELDPQLPPESQTQTTQRASRGGGVARRATRTGTPVSQRYRP